ncbi:hypothetical protein DFS34DRAFT_640887, partial [Phlyctochytrium arcticum]
MSKKWEEEKEVAARERAEMRKKWKEEREKSARLQARVDELTDRLSNVQGEIKRASDELKGASDIRTEIRKVSLQQIKDGMEAKLLDALADTYLKLGFIWFGFAILWLVLGGVFNLSTPIMAGGFAIAASGLVWASTYFSTKLRGKYLHMSKDAADTWTRGRWESIEGLNDKIKEAVAKTDSVHITIKKNE